MKKLLSISIAALMTIGLTNVLVPQQVESEESSPKVLYTDTWTTSYYIDEDTETLYPYIECKSEIFDDGALKITYRNTHKWEDTDNEEHYVTVVGTYPYSRARELSYKYGYPSTESGRETYPVNAEYTNTDGKTYRNGDISRKNRIKLLWGVSGLSQDIDTLLEPDYSYWETVDLTYGSSEYGWANSKGDFSFDNDIGYTYVTFSKDKYGNNHKLNLGLINTLYYKGTLSNLSTDKPQSYTFSPSNGEIRATHKFHVFGHDIEISPEMLNGSNATTEPTVTPTTAPTQSNTDKIKELEAQVKTLTEENEKLKSRNVFDLNDDGKVNVLDLIKLKNYLLGI